MLLFLFILQKTAEIDFTKEKVELAAKLTFGNVMFISLLFTVIDEIRRWFTVTKPVRHIVKGVEKFFGSDIPYPQLG